jgi:hypothetical protein
MGKKLIVELIFTKEFLLKIKKKNVYSQIVSRLLLIAIAFSVLYYIHSSSDRAHFFDLNCREPTIIIILRVRRNTHAKLNRSRGRRRSFSLKLDVFCMYKLIIFMCLK